MGRIKTGMLVGAAVRLASAELIDCVVVNRGDADAGALFVHIDALDGRHKLLSRVIGFEGDQCSALMRMAGQMRQPSRSVWRASGILTLISGLSPSPTGQGATPSPCSDPVMAVQWHPVKRARTDSRHGICQPVAIYRRHDETAVRHRQAWRQSDD